MADHVHILISSPPKYAVSQVICFIKGKSAISIARTYRGEGKILRVRIFEQGGLLCYDSG
jgi:REP element-mobilizing transposase RayT